MLERTWTLLRDTVEGYVNDGAMSRGAAIAYYTIFSIAPLLVIATAIAGTPELVDGACGWLVPAGSVEAVADAMAAAIDASDEDVAAMGREGRGRVAEHHDAVRNGQALVAAIVERPAC